MQNFLEALPVNDIRQHIEPENLSTPTGHTTPRRPFSPKSLTAPPCPIPTRLWWPSLSRRQRSSPFHSDDDHYSPPSSSMAAVEASCLSSPTEWWQWQAPSSRVDPDPVLDGASRVLQQGASGAWCAPSQTDSGGGPSSLGGAPITLGRMRHLCRPGGFIQRERCFSKRYESIPPLKSELGLLITATSIHSLVSHLVCS